VNRSAVLGVIFTLALGAFGGWWCMNSASAGTHDSRFEFSPDGTSVDFDVRDTARRDVLNRLFAGTGIEIKWVDAVFADERIGGNFSGTRSAVARQLLARTNFVIVHDDSDGKPRVIRVVVVGPATGEQSSTGFAAIDAAMQVAGSRNDAPPVTPKRSTGSALAQSSTVGPTPPNRSPAGRSEVRSSRPAPSGSLTPGLFTPAGPELLDTPLLMPPLAGTVAPVPVRGPDTEEIKLIPPAATDTVSIIRPEPGTPSPLSAPAAR
jgi:hypothetical protein